ncbi:MAG: serine/threonine-protein kinase [Candidatus Eisenbacteria bacterium]
MSDAARWRRAQELFLAAAALPESAREAFVARECAGDEALGRDVRALLAADGADGSLLDRGVAHAARAVFASGAPENVGRYRLLRRIGEGGGGVVWLAERPDLGSRVAIKFLRDAWLSPARRERFAREQRTLAQLHHPAIARLFDADAPADGPPWIAMEYVEGVPITEFCARGRLSLRRVLGLFQIACEAVQHAHQQAIVHCDLKPSNLLVTNDGLVKLLDFGIARELLAGGEDAGVTGAGPRPLTPAYAAPEQLRGGRLGVTTDLYALGAMLHELLTGRPPIDPTGLAPDELERRVLAQEPDRASVTARRAGGGPVSPAPGRVEWNELDAIVAKALRKEPAERYRSVESLSRDIGHFLRGEPLEARPYSAPARLALLARRRWRPLALAAAALATIVTLVAFYTVRLEHARNAALAEARRTQRIQAFMTSLFEGDDESGPADTLRVLTLVGRGVQQARTMSGDPLVRGELYQTLGDIYGKLGDLERADTLLRAALDERSARLRAGHPDVVRSLVALAMLRVQQAELGAAESLAARAIARAGELRPADPAALAEATATLGVVQEERGDYPRAIATLERAVVLDSLAGRSRAERAATLTHLANCEFYAGRYARSDSLNRVALAADLEAYGPRDPHVASDLVNLGAIQQEWGRYAPAESLYTEALSIYRGWYGADHYETAATLTMIGRTRLLAGDTTGAAPPLREALAVRERVYGPDHPSVASTLNELGNLALRRGRLADAEGAFRRTVAIYESAYAGRHYLIGIALSNLASVYVERGDLSRAERLYRDALRRYAETLPADHLYAGITRIKLGRTLLRQKRLREAEVESLAGFRIVSRESESGVGWLENARKDLAAIYAGLGRRDEAARWAAAANETAAR